MRVLMVTNEWSGERPGHVPFVAQQARSLRAAGVDLDVFHFRGAQSPLRYARAWRELRRGGRLRRYQLLHAQFGQSGLIGLPPRLPLVVTLRGNDPIGIVDPAGRYTLPGAVLRWVCRLVARLADEVIVVSSSLLAHLPRRHYHVIPGGVDLTLFRPLPCDQARRALGLPAAGRLVLFPFDPADPVKRHWLASAAVRAARSGAALVVAQGQPHERMPLYMNACDALIVTSLHEGSSNALKEALACDLPAVSLDVGDARERLAGLAGCRVVPAPVHAAALGETVCALAAALDQVLATGRLPAGRASVLPLDERLVTQQVLAVYRAALKE